MNGQQPTPDENNGLGLPSVPSSTSTSFVMPDDPPPMPSVASDEDDNNSLDSFEVLSHTESLDIADEKDQPEKSQELPVGLAELRDIRELVNGEITRAESQSTELMQDQQSVAASDGALSTSGSTQSQVEHLIHTNDMLRQNAVHLADSMRSQRDKVQIWQQEVHQCLTNYRNKLIDSRAQVASLRHDNQYLENEIEKLKTIRANLEKDLASLKMHLLTIGERIESFDDLRRRNVELSEEKHALIAKIEDMNDQLQAERLKNIAFSESLAQHPQDIEDAVADLRKTIENKDAEIAKIQSSNDEVKCHYEQQKRQLADEKVTYQALKTQLNFYLQHYYDSIKKDEASQLYQLEMEEQIESLKQKKHKQLLEAEKKLTDVTAQLQKAKETNKKIRARSDDEAIELMSTLRETDQFLTQARKTIQEQQDLNSSVTKQYNIATEKINKLTTDMELEKSINNTLADKLERVMSEKQFVVATSEQARRNHEMEIEELTAELKAARAQLHSRPQAYPEDYYHTREQLTHAQMEIINLEEVIANKDELIESTKKAFDEAKALNDTVFALNSQLELYKSDFELERNLKNNMKEERDQLHEDLQNLHRRNQQLQDELELLREHSDTVVCNAPSPPRMANLQSRGFTCPKCKIEVDDYAILEEHIELCLQ